MSKCVSEACTQARRRAGAGLANVGEQVETRPLYAPEWRFPMQNSLYEMIITDIYAFNRLNSPQGKGDTRRNRDHAALVLKLHGSTAYRMGREECRSDNCHILYLPKGSTYHWTCLEKGECLMIELDCRRAPDTICRMPIKNMQEAVTIFSRLEHLMVFKQRGYMAKCMAGVYKILARIADSAQTDYSLSSKKEKIAPSVEYIEKHYGDYGINNEMLAKQSGISVVYFRKIFTEIYGMPPMQYVNTIKIEKAKGLLISDYGTLEEIAIAAGFGSVYHFCKVFKHATGIAPGKYARLERSRDRQ